MPLREREPHSTQEFRDNPELRVKIVNIGVRVAHVDMCHTPNGPSVACSDIKTTPGGARAGRKTPKLESEVRVLMTKEAPMRQALRRALMLCCPSCSSLGPFCCCPFCCCIGAC